MLRSSQTRMVSAFALTLMIAGPALAAETMVKKTLDGRCLDASHKDYWETKVYVAKPSMAACLKSGGKKAK